MSSCNIDHTLEDVKKKLEDQKSFLPQDLYKKGQVFLDTPKSQDVLNEFFHLLKKYDLVTEEEQQARNEKMALLID
jgi:hypothetical protein